VGEYLLRRTIISLFSKPHSTIRIRHTTQTELRGQRDHERAGDCHYGEKEMRRKNPDTPWSLRFFLTLYRAVSGYGERYLPSLLWAGGLLLASTISYLWWGLHPKDGGAQLTLTSSWDWLRSIFYSFRVMTLLYLPTGKTCHKKALRC
jgi:hypothetical protein